MRAAAPQRPARRPSRPPEPGRERPHERSRPRRAARPPRPPGPRLRRRPRPRVTAPSAPPVTTAIRGAELAERLRAAGSGSACPVSSSRLARGFARLTHERAFAASRQLGRSAPLPPAQRLGAGSGRRARAARAPRGSRARRSVSSRSAGFADQRVRAEDQRLERPSASSQPLAGGAHRRLDPLAVDLNAGSRSRSKVTNATRGRRPAPSRTSASHAFSATAPRQPAPPGRRRPRRASAGVRAARAAATATLASAPPVGRNASASTDVDRRSQIRSTIASPRQRIGHGRGPAVRRPPEAGRESGLARLSSRRWHPAPPPAGTAQPPGAPDAAAGAPAYARDRLIESRLTPNAISMTGLVLNLAAAVADPRGSSSSPASPSSSARSWTRSTAATRGCRARARCSAPSSTRRSTGSRRASCSTAVAWLLRRAGRRVRRRRVRGRRARLADGLLHARPRRGAGGRVQGRASRRGRCGS